jgi:hypothetical protein
MIGLLSISCFFCVIGVITSISRTGSFSTQPFEATPAMLFSSSFFGEGLEYDAQRDRILLSSLNTGGSGGKIYSVPYYNSQNGNLRVTYDFEDMEVVYNGDPRYKQFLFFNPLTICPKHFKYSWSSVRPR